MYFKYRIQTRQPFDTVKEYYTIDFIFTIYTKATAGVYNTYMHTYTYIENAMHYASLASFLNSQTAALTGTERELFEPAPKV